MNVGDQIYVIESCVLGGFYEYWFYVYWVWCDGELVQDWIEGNMVDFFGQLFMVGKLQNVIVLVCFWCWNVVLFFYFFEKVLVLFCKEWGFFLFVYVIVKNKV